MGGGSDMVATPTATPDFGNATAGLTTGFASSMSTVEVTAMTMLVAGMIGVLLAARSSVRRYERLVRAGQALATLVGYALKGVVVAGVATLVLGPVYLLATADAGTQQRALTYLGGGVGVLLALAALGYIGERIYEPIADHHKELTGSRPLESPDEADGGVAD